MQNIRRHAQAGAPRDSHLILDAVQHHQRPCSTNPIPFPSPPNHTNNLAGSLVSPTNMTDLDAE